MESIKNIFTIQTLFKATLVAVMIVCIADAMEGFPVHNPVWVQTSDGQVVAVEQWKIDQMKVLHVLLVHQKGSNSQNNPLIMPPLITLTAQEIELLDQGLVSASHGKFEQFYESLAIKDNLTEKDVSLSLGEGRLRLFINATEKIEAIGLTSLCLSLALPKELHQNVSEGMIKHLENYIVKLNTIHSQSYPRAVAISPDGTKIVSGSNGVQNNLLVWDASTAQLLHNLVGHTGMVTSLAFSPDGTKIVSSFTDIQNNLLVWDASTAQLLHNLVGHTGIVTSVVFSPDGTKIVSSSNGVQNNLLVWDVSTAQLLYNLVGHNNGVRSVAFSPDGTKIVSGGAGNHDNLLVWDCATGSQLYSLAGNNFINSVVFSPDGLKIVAGFSSHHNNIVMWNASTGQLVHNFVGHNDGITSLAFSPDGTKLVSASTGMRNNMLMWDVATGNQLANFMGHGESVIKIVFSPDGTKIFSVSFGTEKNVLVWDVATGKLLHKLTGNDGNLKSLVCSLDGTTIISTDNDKIIIWKFPFAYIKHMNVSVPQIRFLYELSCAMNAEIIPVLHRGTVRYELYYTLPREVQNLIKHFIQLCIPQKGESGNGCVIS